MALKEEFTKSGEWLFRWRSYLPLLLIGLFLVAFVNYRGLFASHAWNRIWDLMCLAVSLSGLGVRILTGGYVPSGTSGRNTRGQIAQVLNTTGAYSLVRHPLYLGNFLIWLGISLVIRVWWFTLLIVLIWWLYYERIMFAEEDYLQERFGEAFTVWAQRTPAFIPRLSNWTQPDLPFSWKTVIGKEYSTLFAIIVVFTLFEIMGEIFLHGRPGIDRMWAVIFLTGLVEYVTVRFIKKRTGWLHVEGR